MLISALTVVTLFIVWLSVRYTVGPASIADGGANAVPNLVPPLRHGKNLETIVGDAHGHFYEATSRGNVFNAQTAATGVAPGTALGTTAAFVLYNPANSGKRLSIHKLAMGLISGTLGAGTVHILGTVAGDAVPTGTAITPRNRAVGQGSSAVATPLTTATVTTLAGKQIGILCSLNEEVVATTAIGTDITEKAIDGEITIEPGYGIALHATAAAGTSPLVVFNATWEEIPIV